MLVRICLLTIYLLNLSSCSGKRDKECRNFKDGKFIHKVKSDGSIIEIHRNGQLQTEFNSANDTVIYTLKWTSPCEYELHPTFKMKELSESSGIKVVGEDIHQLPLKVKIISMGNDFYVFESMRKGEDMVYQDTMWVKK